MTPEIFTSLENGDRVRFIGVGSDRSASDLPPIGSILIRKKDWMDDEHCARFEYEHGDDFHYFYPDEVEQLEGEANAV